MLVGVYSMIDKSSPIPLYHQIRQDIKTKIKSEKFPVNQPIPSESELMQLYNVSRMTVRLAIEELEKEGYVKKIQGKGTFVKKKKMTQQLNTITSWTETMRSQGLNPITTSMQTAEITASEELADQMHIEAGTPLYSILRVKSVEGEPIGISQVYLVANVAPGLILIPQIKDSIYEVLESIFNVELASATETVEAHAAEDDEAKLLCIKVGEPVINVTRLTYDPYGKVIELVLITSRADRYAYTITLNGRKKKQD
jgi:GntR family transcriptional regulator